MVLPLHRGLNAIEEAIGRSTEMGKGVLYIPASRTSTISRRSRA